MAFWHRWTRKAEGRIDGAQLVLPDGGRVPAPALTGQRRADEWLNIVTGHGQKQFDKRTAAVFTCERVSNAEARELWAGDDIARKIVELLPRAMVREGYQIKMAGENEKEKSKALLDYVDTLGVNRVYARAKMFERAYGGSAIWPVANDGASSLAAPLNEKTISTIRYLQLFEPRELVPASWYLDPNEPKYGTPETYRVVAINGGGGGFATTAVIHESRMVIFPGIRVSRELPQHENYGWGDSQLTRVRAVLRDFHLSWGSVAYLLQDFAQGVFKMKGLTDLLAKDKDDVVKRRLEVNDFARSVMKMMAIDSEDDFERKSTPMSGAPEVLIQFGTRLAAACDTPVTKLLGTSPAGMNATGESDTRGWYETVAEEQEDDRPLLERLIRFGMLALDGPLRGEEPKTWRIEQNALWAPSAKEEAETRLLVAQADQIEIDAQMATPDEKSKSRWGGDTYSADTMIDWDAREAQAKASEEAIKAASAGLGGDGALMRPVIDPTQLTIIMDVVERAVAEKLPRDAAQKLLMLSFGFSAEVALDILGPKPEPKSAPPAFPPPDGPPSGEPSPPPAPGTDPPSEDEEQPPKKAA